MFAVLKRVIRHRRNRAMTAFGEGLVAQNKMNRKHAFKKCKQLFEYQHFLLPLT